MHWPLFQVLEKPKVELLFTRVFRLGLFDMKPTPDDPLCRRSQIYPGISEYQLEEIKQYLDDYAAICWNIYERKEMNPILKAEFEAELLKKEK